MKLYATTTSERASKGQGGNDHLNIIITVKDGNNLVELADLWVQETATDFEVIDNKTCAVIKQLIKFESNEAKGKKQKDEKKICRHCGRIHKNDTAICITP